MVYTVTLNPAIDYRVTIDKLIKGEINKYFSASFGPGGKGANVSSLLSGLGVPNVATGFVGGFAGEKIVSMLSEKGCKTDFIKLKSGNSRINIKLCESDGSETEVNGAGPKMLGDIASQLAEKLGNVKVGDIVVLAGSVPPDVENDVYAQIMQKLSHAGALFIVDATEKALALSLKEKPFLVKPNHIELGELFSVEIDSVDKAVEYAEKLLEMGAQNVVVSLGGDGAVFVNKESAMSYEAVEGEMVSTVGAGDSLVAGFIYGWLEGEHFDLAMQWGTAAGAATAFSEGIATGEHVRRLKKQVKSGINLRS